MALRRRKRSTSSTPGACSNWAQKTIAANRPICASLAPLCRAKAVRITPIITASQVEEQTTSSVRVRKPRFRAAGSMSAWGSNMGQHRHPGARAAIR
ncbi:hypothetical protein ASC65_15930 [Brevundimonas sp. Root1279]|nr:hypothetical protein ASC65_15930 [Brevundimonas sp. Root1279]